MLRLGQFFVLLILVVAIFSIPTAWSKGKAMSSLFKQIHNKKAVGDAFPYDNYRFSDNGYGLGDEQALFVIV